METVNNDVITKEIDKYVIDKKELFVKGKIDPKLIKYLPKNPQQIKIEEYYKKSYTVKHAS